MSKTQGIWAVIAIVGLGVAVVLGVVLTSGVTDTSSPWIATVIGLIASTVPSILAMLNSADVKAKLDNGHIKSEVSKALVQQHISTDDSPTAAVALQALAELLKKNTTASQLSAIASDANTTALKEASDNGGRSAV